MRKNILLKVGIAVLLLLCAVPVLADKVTVYGPMCVYESKEVIRDGVEISKTEVKTCTEETHEGKRKFDPDNNFGDYVKKQAVETVKIAIIIGIAG